MTVISFVVPGDPVGKGRPRSVSRKRRDKATGQLVSYLAHITPEKTEQYEETIRKAARLAMRSRPLITGPVLCELHITVAVPQSWSKKRKAMALQGEILPTTKPDKDNVIKAIYDGINGIVWKDDVQAVTGYQRKTYGEVPGVHVRIVPLDAEPAQGRATITRRSDSDNFRGAI